VTKKQTATDRQARLAKIQREQRNAERRRMLAIYGTTALVALVIIGLTVWGLIRNSGGVDGIKEYEDLSRDHVAGTVDYSQSPPAGGEHNEAWQNCGFYAEPVANEYAVHSLEHGAVWITYAPDLPADQVEVLRQDMGTSGYVLVSPYEGQDAPIVLTAWGIQLQVENADDPKVEQFLNKYVQGPQTQEPGAACSGGIDLTGEAAQARLEQEAGANEGAGAGG